MGLDFGFVFSRFCHFYHLSPDYVLAMPARLFFVMEAQISRIRAETDLRRMAVAGAVQSTEGIQKVHSALVIEQGKVYKVEHNAIVPAEPGAMSKLKSLFS